MSRELKRYFFIVYCKLLLTDREAYDIIISIKKYR